MRKTTFITLLIAAMITGCTQSNIDVTTATQNENNEEEGSEMGLGKFLSSIFGSKKETDKEKDSTENDEVNIVIFEEKEEDPTYEYDTPILPSDAPDAKVNGQDVTETASNVPTELPDSPDAAWEIQINTDTDEQQ